jgi:hypothetical protein
MDRRTFLKVSALACASAVLGNASMENKTVIVQVGRTPGKTTMAQLLAKALEERREYKRLANLAYHFGDLKNYRKYDRIQLEMKYKINSGFYGGPSSYGAYGNTDTLIKNPSNSYKIG